MKDFLKAIMIYKECMILTDTHLPYLDSTQKENKDNLKTY